jgi:hypothetical protein
VHDCVCFPAGKQHAGTTYKNQATKNNRAQRDRTKAIQCVEACTGKVEKDSAGKLIVKTFCPACFDRHLQQLQARDAGVCVEELRGPVYGDYRKLSELPSGATLVMSERDSQVEGGVVDNKLVCVVTAEQERAGYHYDRSHPFVVNGKMYWPPVRGIYKEAAGKGYAVRAFADANGVTARVRKQMKLTNHRKGAEVISTEVIARTSSKTMRITAATMLSRKGVPMPEIVEMLEHENEEMTRRYIENYEALAIEKRNYSNVIYAGMQVGPRVKERGEL